MQLVVSVQIAPKEVLVTKGGLSSGTAKLLAQPPIPLQLSYVEPGKEFPDPTSPLQSLTALVSKLVCNLTLTSACLCIV